MNLFPFPLLPRESQRVFSLEQSAENGCDHALSGRIGWTREPLNQVQVATQAITAQLLEAQGAHDTRVLRGSDRAPQWPQGFVGSISHSQRLGAVAVLPQTAARSVGIDVERELDADQQWLVRKYCLVENELDALVARSLSLSETQILTLCFSAKEAVFKCLYPLVKHYFDFTSVRLVAMHESTNLVLVEVLDEQIARCAGVSALSGSFRFTEGHAFTAFRL